MKENPSNLSFNWHLLSAAGMGAVGVASGTGLLAIVPQAQAQTIIHDNFTSGSRYGTSIGEEDANNVPGLKPATTNLPNSTWAHVTGAFYDQSEFTNSATGTNGSTSGGLTNYAGFHNVAAAGISLGAYNSGSLTISANIAFGNVPGQGGTVGNSPTLILGFTSAVNSSSNYGGSYTGTFTGLKLIDSMGSLQQFVGGMPVGNPIAFDGTYNDLASTLLSYTIDTSSGAITNVVFGSSTADYSPFDTTATTFVNADTAYADIGGDANGGGARALVSNFDVSAVPEPSTYALLGAGALALGVAAKRGGRRYS